MRNQATETLYAIAKTVQVGQIIIHATESKDRDTYDVWPIKKNKKWPRPDPPVPELGHGSPSVRYMAQSRQHGTSAEPSPASITAASLLL